MEGNDTMNRDVIAAVKWLDDQPEITIVISKSQTGPRVRIWDGKQYVATAQTLQEALSNLNERVNG